MKNFTLLFLTIFLLNTGKTSSQTILEGKFISSFDLTKSQNKRLCKWYKEKEGMSTHSFLDKLNRKVLEIRQSGDALQIFYYEYDAAGKQTYSTRFTLEKSETRNKKVASWHA